MPAWPLQVCSVLLSNLGNKLTEEETASTEFALYKEMASPDHKDEPKKQKSKISEGLKSWFKESLCYCSLIWKSNTKHSDTKEGPSDDTEKRESFDLSHASSVLLSNQGSSPARRKKSVTFLDKEEGGNQHVPGEMDELDTSQPTRLLSASASPSPSPSPILRDKLTRQSTSESQTKELPVELRSLEGRLNEVFANGFFKTVEEIEDNEPTDHNPQGLDDAFGWMDLKLQISEKYLKAKISEVENMAENLRLSVKDKFAQGFLPFDIELTEFDSLQRRKVKFIGPPMYTHPGGYRFRLEVNPAGEGMAEGTHLSVNIISLKGDHDAILKFPTTFILTLRIMNAYDETSHFTREIECTYEKPVPMREIGSDFEFILLKKLYWNEEKQTLYLNSNKINFRVVRIHFTK